MGYAHFRKGPTKIFYFGLFQPIGDAVKLFSKEFLKGYKIGYWIFLIGPLVGLCLMFFLWLSYLCLFGVYGRGFMLLYIFSVMSLGVYFLLFCGWGSNSKYSLIGGYRAVSQTISYEVTMIFFVLCFVYFVCGYDLVYILSYQIGYWFYFFSFVFLLGWFYVCLAELNRTPFDFSEGESELVSGFNVDYSGNLFSFIFICEYGMIVFIGYLTVLIFFGSCNFILKMLVFCFFIVLVRCTFPRYRYDNLMHRAWKLVLPLALSFLLLFVVF